MQANDTIIQHRCGHRRIFTIPEDMPLAQIAQVKLQPCSWCAYLAIKTDREARKHLPTLAGTYNLYQSFRQEGMSVQKALQEVVKRSVTRCPSCRLDYFTGERMRYCEKCKEIVCEGCFTSPSHCT